MSKFYEIEGSVLRHTHRTCPKCGPGYFLANHYDRFHCGKCGYTVFKRKGKKGKAGTPPKGRGRAPRQRKKAA